MFRRIWALAIALAAHFTAPAAAMTMHVTPAAVELSGPIQPGDAAKLKDLLQTLGDEGGPNERDIVLSSPGGNLLEGIKIGQVIRAAQRATLVARGGGCYSACAVAFLGGTARGAAASDVGRFVEVGAKLGFHGFSASDAAGAVQMNEALGVARIMNALVTQYAVELRKIDLAVLGELLAVPPEQMRVVTTPRELRALSITVKGNLPPRPSDWARNACTREVERLRPMLDYDLEERISARSPTSTIPNLGTLRRMMLTDRFPIDGDRNKALQSALSRLPNDEFLSVMSISAQPSFPATRISLGRGSGFYFDNCYALDLLGVDLQTILIDGVGGTIVTMFHEELGYYRDRAPLW